MFNVKVLAITGSNGFQVTPELVDINCLLELPTIKQVVPLQATPFNVAVVPLVMVDQVAPLLVVRKIFPCVPQAMHAVLSMHATSFNDDAIDVVPAVHVVKLVE